jgi:hypothetical protein
MPNHVYSTLEILGNESTIKKLKDTVREKVDEIPTPLSFNKIIPIPKEEESNWYEWNKKNWGSKWNAYGQPKEDEIEILEQRNNARDFIARDKNNDGKLVIIRYPFQTAWSTVSNVVEKLSEMFPEVKIKYAFLDEGYNFGGYEYFHNGSLVKVKEYDSDKELKKVEKYVTTYSLEESKRDFDEIYQDMLGVF